MTYVFSKKSTANTLALHYFDEVDWKSAFYFAEKWMCDHGFEPNKMNGSRKNITFSRGKKGLERNNFKSIEQDGLWVACLPPDEQVRTEMFDYKACIYISNYNDNVRRSEMGVSWDDTLLSWDEEIFLPLVSEICSLFEPKYGYVFQRKFSLGPAAYTAGVITGIHHPHPEIDEITAWGIIGRGNHSLYKPHFIRDVYPLNFLSPQHLEGPVGGQSLRQWIESDPARGTLAPVVGNLTAWTVDPAHIPALREALRPHNILICFMEY